MLPGRAFPMAYVWELRASSNLPAFSADPTPNTVLAVQVPGTRRCQINVPLQQAVTSSSMIVCAWSHATARWQDQRVSVLLPTALLAAPHRALSHARVELVCLELVHLVGTHVSLLCNHPLTARVCLHSARVNDALPQEHV